MALAAERFMQKIRNKAAIRSFARTWTVELKHCKISQRHQSWYDRHTGLQCMAQSEEQIEQLKTSIVSTVPMGRMGSPDEVAKAASFLASDDSSYVTVSNCSSMGLWHKSK